MIRTENEQINTPKYWDDVYHSEHGIGKQRFDEDRKNFVYGAIRDVKQYFPYFEELTFLDAGCGSAELLCLVHAVFPEWIKTGIDFSPQVIEYCRKYNPNFIFQCADVANTTFAPDQFYLTHCGETLEHVDDPQKVVAELARITRQKGNIVLSVPLRDKNRSPEHIWEFDIEDVINLTKPYGPLMDVRVAANGLSICTSTKMF